MTQTELTIGIFGHDVTREVRLDLIRGETIYWTLVQVSNLADQISALLDQFAFWLLVQLMVQLALELFKLDHFRVLDSLDAVKVGELVIGLLSQLSLDVLDERVELLHSVLLRLLDLLY